MAMICICNNVLLTFRLSSLNTKINTYLRTHLHLAKSQPSALYCLHLTSRSSRPCKNHLISFEARGKSRVEAWGALHLCCTLTLRSKQVLDTLVNLIDEHNYYMWMHGMSRIVSPWCQGWSQQLWSGRQKAFRHPPSGRESRGTGSPS